MQSAWLRTFLPSLGVQLSVLRVFSRIQLDTAFHKDPAARELLPFIQRTTRNMFARMLPPPPAAPPAADDT